MRNPERTCQAATEVLLKTIYFIRSLPSFHHLPGFDQFLLLRSHWVLLFILGLAQEHVTLENLRSCLDKLWRLDLTPKEYVYLKGTILFNPDVPGLINRKLIEGLQRETQQLLHQFIHTLHPHDHSQLNIR
ncbi:hypothetical protein Q7C36_003611 [Tachysurus vachellii]|uniref:NR LBD domain-containing protein n=1 Tax=Tachysurus vachellii TaxID=175792 RepID=A0AA88NVB9_TACVA|nr:hypothetical protein Q7C36_003611 [Tachysurus vachellii]